MTDWKKVLRATKRGLLDGADTQEELRKYYLSIKPDKKEEPKS